MARLDEARARLEAVELLRLLRRAGLSYEELERATGVPRSSLSLYVSGQRLPSAGQARGILESLLSGSMVLGIIAGRLRGLSSVADLADAVLDPLVLRYTALWAAHRYRGRVDVVLSAETYGVPVATAVAVALDARLAVARRQQGSPGRRYITGAGGEPPLGVKLFHLAEGMIRQGDRVILVDDLARTGATLEALARIALAAGAVPRAALVVIAVGGEWRRRLTGLGLAEAHALAEIGG